MQQINSIIDLMDHFGATKVSGIQRAIFKSTECGCTFDVTQQGVSVNGYAEGADAECVPHVLNYPFNITEFYVQLEAADKEGVELFDEWNNADDDDDMQSIIDADDNERELDMNNVIMTIGGGL